jgi:hypothetical protein
VQKFNAANIGKDLGWTMLNVAIGHREIDGITLKN